MTSAGPFLPGALALGAALLGVLAVRAQRAALVRDRLPGWRVPPARSLPFGRRRAERRMVEQLPDVLDASARAAASGLSPVESLRRARDAAAGLLADDLDRVLAAVDGGEPVLAVLERWARRRPVPEVRLTVSAVGQALASGASVARAAHQIADVLRANLDARRVVISQAAQGRASATVVAVAPLVVLLLSALVDTTAIEILLTTPVGVAALVGGLALDGVAAWWMAALIASAERVGR